MLLNLGRWRYAIVLAAGIAVLVLNWLGTGHATQLLKVQDIYYANPAALADASVANTIPVVVGRVQYAHTVKAITVALKFKAAPLGLNYGNLFQTADSLDALRLELQPSGNLVVVFAGGKVYPASARIMPNRIYDLSLNYQRERDLSLLLDGNEVLRLSDPQLMEHLLDLSNVVIGTGMAQQRGMIGEIWDFALDAEYNFTPSGASIAQLLMLLVAGACFLLLLPRSTSKKCMRVCPESEINAAQVGWMSAILVSVLAGVVLAVLALHWMNNPSLIGKTKWLVHITLLLVAIVAALVINPRWFLSPWLRSLIMLLVLVYVAFIITAVRKASVDTTVGILGLFGLLGFLWYQYTHRESSTDRLWNYVRLHWVQLLLSASAFAISWAALSSLTNWDAYRRILQSHYMLSVVGSLIAFRVILDLVFASAPLVHTQPSRGEKRLTLVSLIVGGISSLLFAWVSFRADTLFLPGSAYHWEYFVGPVRGMNSGGWLLWDTPSQYGFFNIVLAYLMPGATPWQQFYVFQGALLLGVSCAIYFTLLRCFPATTMNRVALLGVILLGFFFVDPDFIGPSPYPSSSVVRFFLVYISILILWFIPQHGRRQAVVMGIVWALGVMWSAESSVYVTAIWLFNVAAIFLCQPRETRSVPLMAGYFAAAGASLAVLLLLLSSYYMLHLGVLPDVRSLYDHALGYAVGFGAVPFPLDGPGNILLLLFVGLFCIAALLRIEPDASIRSQSAFIAGMAGALWSISTYYIGRAVPQNFTAILPMVLFIAVLATRVAGGMRATSVTAYMRAMTIPILFVVSLPAFSVGWFNVVGKMKSWSSDITVGLPVADHELTGLIRRVNPGFSLPMAYYGDEAAPPVMTESSVSWISSTWLPVPFQLLEAPVSEARRAIYLNRSICRRKIQTGLIITGGGDAMTRRLAEFLREFEKYYRIERLNTESKYTAYRLTDFDRSQCP
jgi:hypothetical protein